MMAVCMKLQQAIPAFYLNGDHHGHKRLKLISCKSSTREARKMAGKRLLDAAAFFKAVRGVAAHGQSLRNQRLERYSKTSSLARAIKDQTDRVTLTVKAAAALSDRLNSSSTYSTQAGPSSGRAKDNSIPAKESLNQASSGGSQKSSLEPDHFYHQSPKDVTAQPTTRTDLPVHQEQASEIPLPDGTIPPKGTNLADERNEDVSSRTPTAVPPKNPLEGSGEGSLEPQMSSRSSIPRPADSIAPDTIEPQPASKQNATHQGSSPISDEAVPKVQAVPEQEPITEEMYSEIFQSPRIAKLLRNDPKRKHDSEMRLSGTQKEGSEPFKDAKVRDQETFNSAVAQDPPSEQQNHNSKETNSKLADNDDFAALGKDLAKDAQTTAEAKSTVGTLTCIYRNLHTDRLTDS